VHRHTHADTCVSRNVPLIVRPVVLKELYEPVATHAVHGDTPDNVTVQHFGVFPGSQCVQSTPYSIAQQQSSKVCWSTSTGEPDCTGNQPAVLFQ
jgi:hypothetical protein